MILHRLVGLGLVAAVLVLAPVAYASPPDQTWIDGVYDDADFDDIIVFITSGLGALQPNLVWSPRVVTLVVGLVTPTNSGTRPLFSLSPVLSRSPPLA